MSDSPATSGIAVTGPMLHELVRSGRSFSGRERNCCFLNLGDGRFADISSVSGLDFPDDGRAVARIDWDFDGDLDLWIANRSGPQVRFLRNDRSSDNHFLSVRLEGRNCNRDAIGARVELVLKNGPTLLRTVRAGEGFLAQSSKWLQFGLGESPGIDKLVVRWPDGLVEELGQLPPDQHYRIVQGSATAEPWDPPVAALRCEPQRLVEPATTVPSHVFSAAMLPIPRWEYRTFAGETRAVVERAPSADHARPRLVNLWASWCAPCVRELAAWGEDAAALREAGVEVLALSVDAVESEQTGSVSAARSTVARLELPFQVGLATEATVEQMQLVHDHLFDLHRPLAVPTSFLIDSSGRLAAIYRGPVSVDQLLNDIETANRGAPARLAASIPFPGRWSFHRAELNPLHLVWKMIERSFQDEALEYIEQNRALLARHYDFHKLLVLAGNGQLARGDASQAAALYQEALLIDGDYVDALNNLAWLQATQSDETIRNTQAAMRHAEKAVQNAGDRPSLLDTLSAAYAANGRFEEAVDTATRAIELARAQGQPQLAEKIGRRLRAYKAGQPYRGQ